MPHTVTIVHISDLHARGPGSTDSWRRRRMVGADTWIRNLDELETDWPIDLIVFSGDLAQSGHPEEYGEATDFLDLTLRHLRLDRSRLAIVPGNHDIDRGIGTGAWQLIRRNLHRFDDLEISRWLAGGEAPFGLSDELREQLLERQNAFRSWLTEFGLAHLAPARSPHGRLGFRHSLRLPGRPFAVHLIGLDSAWLCGDDSDSGRLRLTEDQVMRLASDAAGRPLPGLRLALVHHALSDFTDGTPCRRLLSEHVDAVLRGHLHELEPELWADPDRSLRQFAAGCLYGGSGADHHANGYTVIRVHCDDEGHPQRYDLRFRCFSPRTGFWVDDGNRYRSAPSGRLTLSVSARPPVDKPVAGTIQPRVFVGRQSELRRLAAALLPSPGEKKTQALVPVVLIGMGGVGKSTLAQQFFRLHGDQFPGGLIQLVLPSARQVDSKPEVLLRQLADQLRLQPSGLSLQEALLRRLRQPWSLLLIENIDSELAGEAVAGLVSKFPGCAVLLTGRLASVGSTAGWTQIPVATMAESEAMELLAAGYRRAADQAESEEQRALVRALGYLPPAIQLAAGHLRRGRTTSGFLHLLAKKALDVLPADPANPLRWQSGERATLMCSFQLSLDLLREQLGHDAQRLTEGLAAFAWVPSVFVGPELGAEVAGLTDIEFERLMVQACALSIVQESGLRWRLHPLMAQAARSEGTRTQALARLAEWFLRRLPRLPSGQAAEQGQYWQALNTEREALTEWLSGLTGQDALRAAIAGYAYAQSAGPFLSWAMLCERELARQGQQLDQTVLRELLPVVLQRGGYPQEAEKRARELLSYSETRRQPRGVALAKSQLASLWQARGELNEALRLFRECADTYEQMGAVIERATALSQIAIILQEWGQLDEAIKILKEQVLPVYKEQGDLRGQAVTLLQVANISQERGQLDSALQIYREECLPIFERLGNIHATATTISKLADILRKRGQLGDALRAYQEECLPVFDRLGDSHSRAATLACIADILRMHGQLDQALRLYREECLPVYAKVGDIRAQADTMAAIAGILQDRGELDEALRIHREECLPIYERVGNVRGKVEAWGKVAGILRMRGESEEALRIRRDECLPIYEKLGDMYGKADTLGEVSAILQEQGQLEEALEYRRDREEPLYQKLGDVRARAIVRGKLAGIYQMQGKLREALTLVQEQVLPDLERLGDVRVLAISRIQLAGLLRASKRFDEAIGLLEKDVLPMLEPLRIVRPLSRAYYSLARALLDRDRQGDRARAREQLEKAYELSSPPGLALAERVRALQLRHSFIPSGIGPINRAVVENVRSIAHLELELHPRLTVLYGRNACGKTTILGALAFGLSAVSRLLQRTSQRRYSDGSLLRRQWANGDAAPRIAAYCRTTLIADALSWSETLHRDRDAGSAAGASVVGSGNELAKRLAATLRAIQGGQGEWDKLPVFAYYNVERAVEQQAQQAAQLLSAVSRLDAAAGALEPSGFQAAVDWFRTLEDREHREREKRGDSAYRSPALEAVRRVLEKVLPGCSRPRISEPPERLVVEFARPDGIEILDLSQLSDGYRTHLALVLDLARRMVQANPPPPDEQPEFRWGVEAPAWVLVDEVDLHLHPEWQQRVLPDLLSAFPATQFIVTTHSDQVLSSVPPESYVYSLVMAPNGLRIQTPELPVSGARSEQILAIGMGVEPRSPTEWSATLAEYLALIDRGAGETEAARGLRCKLNELRPDDPDLLRADVRIRRKKLMS